jgi:hypothetical protein
MADGREGYLHETSGTEPYAPFARTLPPDGP